MLYDRDIREPLFDFLEEQYGKVRIIEEKQMGRSRADIVMITEHALTGIEIKSDADTYSRLERQIHDYDQFFDYNCIVIGSTHAQHVKEHIPGHWGIITVDEIDGQADFYLYREMMKNNRVDLCRQLSLLWRPELSHIQQLNEMPRYREKSKQFVIDKIAAMIPHTILKKQISEELFERDYLLIADEIRQYQEKHGKPYRKRKSVRQRKKR